MKPTDRQKICSNCDGQIGFDALECPYCGTAAPKISSFSASPLPSPFNKNLQDNSASLYPPPYGVKKPAQPSFTSPPSSPLDPKNYLSDALDKKQSAPSPIKTENTEDEKLWPVFAFAIGATLLTLGLILFFFSEGGKLSLEWDASFWFVYCLAAAPLLFLGLKKISSKKNDESAQRYK